jgi:fructose-1,6-bisphosphatase/inositol monophosphatase family enzyme
MKSALWDEVAQVLREAAALAVMPAFAAETPAAAGIDYKSPGEPVTAADREAEALIGRGLLGLVPGAAVIGEEACAADPALLDRLGTGLVWLVDPIDGTGNFAAGRGPFALMVALLDDGELRGSCIFQPLSDRLAVAELGGGAWINGRRLDVRGSEEALHELTGIVSEAFIPADRKPLIAAVRREVAEVVPTARCAGYEYPQVACGERDFAIYWRTLAWDHAPGALLLREAGGCVTHLDGEPYRPTEPKPGLLLARTPQIASKLLEVIRKA